MRKTYKHTKTHKSSGVVKVLSKGDSNQSVIYFEEPELQKSFEKFSKSVKNLPIEEQKKLVKELFED